MTRFLITLVAAALISFLVAYAMVQKAPQGSDSLYARVMDSGTIRCGYVVVEPGLIKDANTGQLSGIVYDLVETMAKNLSLKIEWTEEYGPGELVAALENGRADMICSSVWLSTARARVIDATDTLYVLPSTIWMRQDAKTPASFDSPDITFVAIEGSTSMRLTKAMFPKAKINALPEMNSIAENLLAVAAGKGDATILPVYVGERFLAHNPGSLRNALDKPLRNDPTVLLIPRNQFEFKSMINSALRELQYTGYVEQLIEAYNQHPGAIVAVSPQ